MRCLAVVAGAMLALTGCKGCDRKGRDVPPVPASSDPAGQDLVPGAIVAAVEKSGGIRLYKVLELNWFPDPIGDELVMIAYEQKADTFEQARELWIKHELVVALPKVRVARHMFMRRDHRVIASEPVAPEDKSAKSGDRQSKPQR
jgi:hypothetical protein